MLTCVHELGEEDLDPGCTMFAIERVFDNAQAALAAYAVDEELPPVTFPRRDEFPKLLWMTPPDRLLARLRELSPSATALPAAR